jgi:hypothetical protein
MDARFFLPVVPLACFYIWQGVKETIVVSREKPRVVGIIWFPAALLASISGAHWIYRHCAYGYGDFLDKLLIPLWLISAGCALRMAYSGQSIFRMEVFSNPRRWFGEPVGRWRVTPHHMAPHAGWVIVTGLVLIGVVMEARIVRENLIVGEISVPEVEAGLWLRAHTAPDSVFMADDWGTVRHYADRKSVWFAPISDPRVLLGGIARHDVDYVVVVKHAQPYYLPDDDYCFDRLLAIHAESFQLVLQKDNLRIFQVNRKQTTEVSTPRP